MKKMPTLFKRNFGLSVDCPATDEVTFGCEWVLQGEGQAYAKYDGTCVGLFGGKLYRRRTLRPVEPEDGIVDRYAGGEFLSYDPPNDWCPAQRFPRRNGKWPGWRLVDPEAGQDKWVVDAFERTAPEVDGTFEAVGPKFQGNPHGFDENRLIRHLCRGTSLDVSVTCFGDVYGLLVEMTDYEGAVWRHPDGRMAKIKRTDFGLKWPV